LKGFGQAEVEHLHRAIRADLDVGGLQVAMDDPLLVRGFQRLGDLLRNGERLIDGNRAAGDALRQVVALDEFHHDCGEVRGLLEAVNRRDVGMVERREHFGFPLEARQTIRIAGQRRGQHFDRHRPLQVAVGLAIHFAHPACADRRGDLVDAETGAGSEGQVAGLYRRRRIQAPRGWNNSPRPPVTNQCARIASANRAPRSG